MSSTRGKSNIFSLATVHQLATGPLISSEPTCILLFSFNHYAALQGGLAGLPAIRTTHRSCYSSYQHIARHTRPYRTVVLSLKRRRQDVTRPEDEHRTQRCQLVFQYSCKRALDTAVLYSRCFMAVRNEDELALLDNKSTHIDAFEVGVRPTYFITFHCARSLALDLGTLLHTGFSSETTQVLATMKGFGARRSR